MSKVLQYLAAAINGVTEDDISALRRTRIPEAVNEETGREFGVLTPYLVRLQVVLFGWADERKALGARMSLLEGTEERLWLKRETEFLETRIAVVRDLFWAELREELSLWADDAADIGIRGDWRVVELLDPICLKCGKRHPKMEIHGLGISFPWEALVESFAGFGEESEAANA